MPANIVILDACRNNPYERARGNSRGLARERTPIGTIVAYATEPGSTADDGDSRNGVYTQYLAQFIKQPGLTVHKVFEKTALAVEKQTKGNQRPREENGLRGDYYFQLANLDVRPGPKPPVSDLNLDDLENQSRSRAEQEARQKGEWATWQSKMLAAYQRLDKLSGADLQVKGWESFLSSYSADNPYSAEDEQLRQQAQQKLASARTALQRQSRPQTPGSNFSANNKAGQGFRDCDDVGCPEMVWIPKGSFMMGSNEKDSEKQIHKVTIHYELAVGKYPVTFEQWDACLAAGGCSHLPDDKGWGRGTRPVINVSWEDTKQYIQWLNKKTGKSYRLLSEAEWEYAARAGTATRYYWGDDIGSGYANCDGCGSQWDATQTSPVGSFAPNKWGLYDMAGNVWNWVSDCWHENYDGSFFRSGAPSDGSAWNSENCGNYILRGGAWNNGAQFARAASRNRYVFSNRFSNLGFRIARIRD